MTASSPPAEDAVWMDLDANGTEPAGAALLRALVRFEPWLVLLAAPPLVLAERFPPWAALAALAWIGLLWGARRAVTGRWTRATGLDAPIIALLLTVPLAVEAAAGLGPAARQAAISRAQSLAFGVALYFALVNAMTSPRRAWSAVTWLLVAGLGLVAVGIVSVSWLEKFPALTPVFPRLIPTVPHPTLETGVHPNQLAALLAPCFCLALVCLLAGRADPDDPMAPPRWLRPIATLTVALTGLLLLVTQSRGAWLAVLATVAVWIAGSRRWLATAFVAALLVAGIALAGLGPARVAAELGLGAPEAANAPASAPGAEPAVGRLRIWRDALELLAASPTTGIGLNSFPLVHGRREEYDGGFIYQGLAHAHNTLLQAALDFGLAGLVAVVGLYVAAAWTALRAHRRLAKTALDPLVVGLALGLLAVALHGLVDALAIGAKPGFVVWAFAGVLAGVRARARRWVAPP
jgi:putative inorganic carbon (HCO3(-)) transporter